MKSFFRSKSACFYIEALGILLGILAVILYISFGKNVFNRELSLLAILPAIIGFVLGTITLFIDVQPLNDISFLLILYGFISYIGSQVNYIANVFTSIDGSSFSVPFILTMLFFLLSLVASLISIFLPKEKDRIEVQVTTERRN